MQAIRLLLVEDSSRDAKLLVRALNQAGFEADTRIVRDREDLEEALQSATWDLVICDYELPTLDAPEAVAMIRSTKQDVPILVVSGKVGEESAVAVMRAGAQDYLTKDRLFRLGEVVRRELAEVNVRRDRAAAERALLTSEERLRFAMNAAQVGVWDWDMVADRFEWMRQGDPYWDARGAVVATFQEGIKVVFAEDRDRVSNAFQECRRGERPALSIEYRTVRPNGDVRWLDVRGQVVRDPEGRALRMAGAFLDITDRRVLEERLAQNEKMKIIGQMAGTIAHDFNNLLTVILTYGQLLHDSRPDGEQVVELSAPIVDAAERAATLTRQLLVFSQRQTIEPKVLDLNEVIRAVSRLLVRLVGERVKVETSLTPNLGRVRMDRSQCEQVLLNLAVNARDAMPRGGKLRIATENGDGEDRKAEGPGHVMLEVSDTGEGMSEEVQRKAFQAFFTTKAHGRGTGLGLATCQTVVANAGGTISLTSAPGRGTTFRILLPRTEERLDSLPPQPRDSSKRIGAEAVLVVEDDALVRASSARALRAAGYVVTTASSGEEALASIKERPDHFKLMLSDVVMPGLGGVELLQAVRQRAPKMKVLLTSGYSQEAIATRGTADTVGILPKPYTAEELTRRVSGLLEALAR
jgi:signal transduction histidine kinase